MTYQPGVTRMYTWEEAKRGVLAVLTILYNWEEAQRDVLAM